jgi:hypothetical protein
MMQLGVSPSHSEYQQNEKNCSNQGIREEIIGSIIVRVTGTNGPSTRETET